MIALSGHLLRISGTSQSSLRFSGSDDSKNFQLDGIVSYHIFLEMLQFFKTAFAQVFLSPCEDRFSLIFPLLNIVLAVKLAFLALRAIR